MSNTYQVRVEIREVTQVVYSSILRNKLSYKGALVNLESLKPRLADLLLLKSVVHSMSVFPDGVKVYIHPYEITFLVKEDNEALLKVLKDLELWQ